MPLVWAVDRTPYRCVRRFDGGADDQAAGGIRDAPQNGAARFLSAEWKIEQK